MTAPLPRATAVVKQAAPGSDTIALEYEARFVRRKRMISDQGTAFLVDLPETVSLNQGSALMLEDGRHIAVQAAPEALYYVTGPALARLAWHVGNRHTPCHITDTGLYIRQDPVLAQMLRGLGAEVRDVLAPFTPEGGAYGHGRTLGHDHGHDHS